MVFMIPMQALRATYIALSAMTVDVGGVSNVVVAMIAMNIVNARLPGDSQAHLEMRTVTPSTLNGTTAYREITFEFLVEHCL
jgi:hypothetical protein